MLADSHDQPSYLGSFSRNIDLPSTALLELINFIAEELPQWRKRIESSGESAEETLTSRLCAHLASAARRTPGWDFLQFRVEEPDQQRRGRKIDLVPAPCDAVVMVDGRRYIDFDSLLPIECKRFPTPTGKKRDEREYVINRKASTGGIQRFKAGHHGASHNLGAMIAYVQEDTAINWFDRVTQWIKELAKAKHTNWSLNDLLSVKRTDGGTGLSTYRSIHTRDGRLDDIELHHLWIVMK